MLIAAHSNAPIADRPSRQVSDGCGRRFTNPRSMAAIRAITAITPTSSTDRK